MAKLEIRYEQSFLHQYLEEILLILELSYDNGKTRIASISIPFGKAVVPDVYNIIALNFEYRFGLRPPLIDVTAAAFFPC